MKIVYVNGYVGNLATRILIENKFDELQNFFNKEFLYNELEKFKNNSLVEDGIVPSLFIGENIIIDKEQISKGGVLTALWKICDRNKWGLKYNLKAVPIKQSTIEIANYFDINPYRLLTENAYVYVIEEPINESARESEFVRASSTSPLSRIGIITNEKKRVRIDGEAEAFLTKDYKDEIEKVIPKFTKEK